ncbi:MAG: hypothetical protein NW214_06175 [Pseudanabaenaceae cyanobacterium bins.39]|nr:hypothetical protein [Pseudanabaenaceae cyanobacterium bins.39]
MLSKSIYACNPSYIVGCTNFFSASRISLAQVDLLNSHPDHPNSFNNLNVQSELGDQVEQNYDYQNYDYYIDLAAGRGEDVVKRLRRTIALSPNRPTMQCLFGNKGSGKTTELFRLKHQLEQQGFVVIYGAIDHYLVMGEVKSPEIGLLLIYLVIQYLENQMQMQGKPVTLSYLPNAIAEIENWLRILPPESWVSYSSRLLRIFQFLQDHPQQSRQIKYLRHYLEPCLKGSLLTVADELTTTAIDVIKKISKKGLVILLDNLDHLPLSQIPAIFNDGGKYLQHFPCHIVYTLRSPESDASLSISKYQTPEQELDLELNNSQHADLIFRNILQTLPKNSQLHLPKLQLDHHNQRPEVLDLLRQIVLVRLLPTLTPDQRLANITGMFDRLETLDELCTVSKGDLSHLIAWLYGCWQLQDPPFSAATVKEVLNLHFNYTDLLLGATYE